MAGPGRPKKVSVLEVGDVAQVTLFDEDGDEDLEGEELDTVEEVLFNFEAPEGDYVGEEELYEPEEFEDDGPEIDEYLFPAFRIITTSFSRQGLLSGEAQTHARNIADLIKAGDYRVVTSQLLITGSGDEVSYVYWVTLARDW